MSRRLVVLISVLVGVLLASAAQAAVSAVWRPIGSASASGDFAIASANGEAKRPLGLRVRLLGNTPSDLSIIYSCSRDAKLRPGQVVTLAIRGAENCNVIASGSGDGRLTIRIEALR
jgi:hypothetical protein